MGKLQKTIARGIVIFIIAVLLSKYIYELSGNYYRNTVMLHGVLHLNRQHLVLKTGEAFQLRINGINKRVSYYSNDFKVAGVSPAGRVFALRPGRTFIVAKVDGKKLKCRVNVIALNKKKLTLKVGDTKQLKVKGILLARKTYESTSPEIVSISSRSGKLTAHKKGTAYILVRVKGEEMVCKVTVR